MNTVRNKRIYAPCPVPFLLQPPTAATTQRRKFRIDLGHVVEPENRIRIA